MAGAVQVGHGDGDRTAVEQAAGDMLGHLVERGGAEDVAGAQGGEQDGRVEPAGHGVHVRVAEDDAHGVAAVLLDQWPHPRGHQVERLLPGRLAQRALSRTSGVRNRSGSASSSPNDAPFGQMNPWLKTSSRSPRALVTRVPSMVRVSPQVASHRGQTRRAVRAPASAAPDSGGGAARGVVSGRAPSVGAVRAAEVRDMGSPRGGGDDALTEPSIPTGMHGRESLLASRRDFSGAAPVSPGPGRAGRRCAAERAYGADGTGTRAPSCRPASFDGADL